MTHEEMFAKRVLEFFKEQGTSWMLEAMQAPMTPEGDATRRECALKYQLTQRLAATLAAQIAGVKVNG